MMSTTKPLHQVAPASHGSVPARELGPALLVAVGLVLASAYGFWAADPYPGLDRATTTAARAQDVCSLLVAGLLVVSVVRRDSPRSHLVRLGLMGYVAYSYFIYVEGMAMTRAFLLYVVLVAVSVGALLDGVVRLEPAAWTRSVPHRLERATGWFLVVVAGLFATLWLTMLLPFALGGPRPDSEGPGGAPFPVFVLDLAVVLPCVLLVGLLLLDGHPIGRPLAVVVLVKIITLFTTLWAGTLAGLLRHDGVHLGADAVPSLLMLAGCCWLLSRWASAVDADGGPGRRPTFWPALREPAD
jgi:hypothetical protein